MCYHYQSVFSCVVRLVLCPTGIACLLFHGQWVIHPPLSGKTSSDFVCVFVVYLYLYLLFCIFVASLSFCILYLYICGFVIAFVITQVCFPALCVPLCIQACCMLVCSSMGNECHSTNTNPRRIYCFAEK